MGDSIEKPYFGETPRSKNPFWSMDVWILSATSDVGAGSKLLCKDYEVCISQLDQE